MSLCGLIVDGALWRVFIRCFGILDRLSWAVMGENPYNPPQSDQPLARKRRGLGKLLKELDDEHKDMVLLVIGLFVVAPLIYFLFYW